MTAEEYANDFIVDFLDTLSDGYSPEQQVGSVIHSDIIKIDPDFKVLNSKLNEIGWNIKSHTNTNLIFEKLN